MAMGLLPSCRWAAALSLTLVQGAAMAAEPADDGSARAGGSAAQLSVAAGLQYRTLTEWTDSGQKLLSETGAMPHLQLGLGSDPARGPALAAELSLAGAPLSYQGQTQAGVPLATTSRHRDLALAGFWRPVSPGPYGEVWLAVRRLEARRNIASSALASGLVEQSSLLMPGLRWRSPQLTAPSSGTTEPLVFQFDAEFWQSARHRLNVDYLGLFDPSVLDGGTRRQWVLRASVWSQDSPWRWSAQWGRSRQQASESVRLLRAGATVGSVRQPRVAIDDVLLQLSRAF